MCLAAGTTAESVAYHHFHADVAVDAVHEDVAGIFISILPLMRKRGGGGEDIQLIKTTDGRAHCIPER